MLPVPQSLGVWAVTLNRANTKRLFKSILQISSDFYIAYSSKLMLVEGHWAPDYEVCICH